MLERLNLLSKKELFKFGQFIESPYFNTVENVKLLFRYLKSLYPDINENDIENKKLFKVIYGNKKFDDVKIRKLKSNFRKTFEEFLIQTETEEEKSEKILLLKALRKHGFRKEFSLILNETKRDKKFKKNFSKNGQYYLFQTDLNTEEFYNYYTDRKYNLAKLLQNKSDNLDLFFAFSKLHTFHEMLLHNYERDENFSFKLTFFSEIFDYIKSNEKHISKSHPNLYIIYLVYKMYTDKAGNFPKMFVEYLNKNGSYFSKTQLGYYYRYLESYYWMNINDGHTEFRKDVLKIYKTMISKKVFLLEEYINDNEFNNVINSALPLGEFAWTENFIEENKKYLKSDLSEETFHLAKAKLYFYKKDMDKALLNLNDVHYKDPHYFVNSKFLLARVQYELKNYEMIYNVLASLEQYTRRGKFNLNTKQRKNILIFRKYINYLLKLNEPGKKNSVHILKKMLLNEKYFISGKSWFLEKVTELETKK